MEEEEEEAAAVGGSFALSLRSAGCEALASGSGPLVGVGLGRREGRGGWQEVGMRVQRFLLDHIPIRMLWMI